VYIQDKKFDLFLDIHSVDDIINQVANKLKKQIVISEHPVIFLVVLKGAITFAVKLTEKLSDVDIEIECIRLSSYEGTQSSGNIIEVLGISRDISGRDVIIIEDIVETGLTMNYLKYYLTHDKKVNSVKICSLFTRPKNYKYNVFVDFVGMELNNNEFIIGCGLDYNELGRNLNEIYKLTN
jgi:hypoxanthine phosphoribosyltransferase